MGTCNLCFGKTTECYTLSSKIWDPRYRLVECLVTSGQTACVSDETLTLAHMAHVTLVLGELSMLAVSKVPCVSDDQCYGFQDQIPGTEDCGAVRSQQTCSKQQSFYPEEHVSIQILTV